MTDLPTSHLSAADEPTLQAALATMSLWSTPGTDSIGEPTGGYVLSGPWGHLDVIGTMYEPTGAYTTDPQTGAQVPVMAAIAGFHANLVTSQALSAQVAALVVSDPGGREFSS